MSSIPRRRWSTAVPLALVLCATLWLVSAAAGAAERPEPPPFFAIRDARVVTVSGDVLERATVVVEHGLITAIAPDAPIPPEAWVLDGAGLTVYPGLIDTLTTVGQKPETENGGGAQGGRGGGGGNPFAQQGPEIRGPEDRPGTTPWKRAADEASPEDDRLEKWRMAGFTTVISSPEEGFFPGQASALNTAGEEGDDMVVDPGVAQRISLSTGRGRSFPGSLMGVIAYVRQVFLDVDHYAKALEIYGADPTGLERPEFDRTLEPLREAKANGLPFLLPGDDAPSIQRALRLTDELGLEAVIYGGRQGYAVASELAQAGVPVVVSVDWPELAKDRDPDADADVRELIDVELAPTTPAELHAAGVPFTWSSQGTSSASEALEGIRKAVESGLDPGVALEAATLGAARVFGLDDRLGSIEVGKIANLVVASDYPWAEGVEVAAVFVDGRRFAEREDTGPKEAPAVDVSGTWTLTVSTPRGERESTAELEMAEDGKVTGEVTSERGSTRIESGRVAGATLTLELSIPAGPRTTTATYTGTVEGESVSGSVSMGPMSGEFSGTRTVQAEAGESADDDAPSGPRLRWSEVTGLSGPYLDAPVIAIENVDVITMGPQGTIEDGTVVVRDGKIAAVGKDVRVPNGAQRIDGTDRWLIPGIIDAHSHIAVEGSVNEGSLAVTSMVGIEDVVDPTDIGIYRALAGGVTSVNILHGSANPIGGKNEVIKLRWGADADGLDFEGAPEGIKFALGENPKRSNSGGIPGIEQRYPATRMGVMDVIRQVFVDAKEYQAAWKGYEAAQRAGRRAIPPRRDMKLEALVEILEGERLVHCHSYRADEILQVMRLAEEMGFQIRTLQHVLEGYRVADEIATHGAGASTFSDWWAYKVEAYNAIPHNAAIMTRRGVLVSINSDDAEEMRHLNLEAAKTIKWGGLSEEEALALVTLNPAKQLGIDGRVGSIEEGKDADLVLYQGHPLSAFAKVEKTFVDGKVYFDVEGDRARRSRIAEIEALLTGQAGDEGEATEEAPTTPETPDTPVTTPRTPDDPEDPEDPDDSVEQGRRAGVRLEHAEASAAEVIR
ncbi:MAG TPA: amidohydrolase family protein [Thermoanaerobaculia bacterium]|nr:amidohydrolase family protein [Thermoanaerobaculia bacterium]